MVINGVGCRSSSSGFCKHRAKKNFRFWTVSLATTSARKRNNVMWWRHFFNPFDRLVFSFSSLLLLLPFLFVYPVPHHSCLRVLSRAWCFSQKVCGAHAVPGACLTRGSMKAKKFTLENRKYEKKKLLKQGWERVEKFDVFLTHHNLQR